MCCQSNTSNYDDEMDIYGHIWKFVGCRQHDVKEYGFKQYILQVSSSTCTLTETIYSTLSDMVATHHMRLLSGWRLAGMTEEPN